MASAPLIARRREVRGEIFGVIALAAIGTALLGLHYAGQSRAGRIDTAIDSRLQHHLDHHLRFLHRLVALADPLSVTAICLVLVALFLFSGRRRAAALVVLGPAIAAGFTEFVLKPLIGRRLDDALSFPSGHTTGAVSVAVVVVVVILGPNRPGWPKLAGRRPRLPCWELSRWRPRWWARAITTRRTLSAASAWRSASCCRWL